MTHSEKRTLLSILAAGAMIEMFLFAVLLSLTPERFRQLVSSPDTDGYIEVALALFKSGALIASPRTLGYPVFLFLAYVLGGLEYGPYLAIGAQLIVNLVFTWGCWELLRRITPSAPKALRVALTLFFFWAGLGMALELLSDFLASFFFGMFLFGLLFWRSRRSLFVSATALAVATLIRPTFTFVPLVIPIAAILVSRCTSKVPTFHIAGFVLASLAATGISTAYQYSFQGYVGPSPVLAVNIGRTLGVIGDSGFSERVSQRAGQPYSAISASDEERYALELFREEFEARPSAVLVQLSTTVVKYLLAPVEVAVTKSIRLFTHSETASHETRVILGVLCLPVWLLALVPPVRPSTEMLAYYLLVAALVAVILGLSSIAPFQGERIRFPVLAFMLPVAAFNTAKLSAFMTQRFHK